MSRSPETSRVSMGMRGRIDAQPPRIRLALGIAHLPHRPARALQFRGRVGQTRIVGEHGLEGGPERVRRSARLFRDEPPFREPLHGNAERVRLRGDLGLPLGDPDERGGRVGKGPPESGAERRGLLQGGLVSEIPSTSNPSLVSICSPATAITHVPFLSPP